jgi:CubicO group peptidase (beta-lactamase class C family)
VAGVLIERVAGAPLAEVLRERVFEPLGMADTGFYVPVAKRFGWDGGSGTTWRTDMKTGLTGILLTQRMATSPEPTELVRDFWAAAYASIDA